MRVGPRMVSVGAAVAAGVLLLSGAPAGAATVGAVPVTGSWGPYQSCGPSQPHANCASVFTVTAIGSTVYIGGDFTALVDPATGGKLAVNDLAALDADGVPVPFTSHVFDGTIRALTTDGSRLFVGGSFRTVDGAGPGHLAVFDAAGTRLRYPGTGSPLRSLAIGGSTLYAGGSTVRALDLATGAPLAGFAFPAMTDAAGTPKVWSLAAAGPRLYLGGHFDSVGGSPHRSVVAVDATTGAVDEGFNATVDATANDPLQGIGDLAVTADAVFAAQDGHTNAAYRYNLDGSRVWSTYPSGDVQTLTVDGGTVYLGGHFQHPLDHIMAVAYGNGALDTSWQPAMGVRFPPYYYGVWVVRKLLGELWAGGVFNSVTVNGTSYPARKIALFR